ncbi:hypothetical protein HDU88_008316 [Geranomyces variabilis]|nr:hypothetical protein HDU88_008316 [Geranomyces variabilis]
MARQGRGPPRGTVEQCPPLLPTGNSSAASPRKAILRSILATDSTLTRANCVLLLKRWFHEDFNKVRAALDDDVYDNDVARAACAADEDWRRDLETVHCLFICKAAVDERVDRLCSNARVTAVNFLYPNKVYFEANP